MAEGVRFSDLTDSKQYIEKRFNDMLFVSDLSDTDVTLKVSGRQLAAAVQANAIGGSQINIRTKKLVNNGVISLYTILESVSGDDLDQLADSDKYRLCLMRFRKGSRGGRNWHIPAFPYFYASRMGTTVNPKDHAIPEHHTWWPVTGNCVAWFRRANIFDVLPFGVNAAHRRFKNSRNIKMLDGVALFHYTGHGTEGWTRISNIAYVESYLCARTSPNPYVSICIKA